MTPPAASPSDDEPTRLRAAIAERDDLLAMVAHELRNPLHALTLQLAVARAGAEAHAEGETAARVAKAQVTLARYVDRVTVLLELARLNAAAYPLDAKPVDLAALLRQLADSLAPEARFRGVRLVVELPPDCGVVTDPLVVEQIVDNLLLNAFKHSGAASVTLRLRRLDAGRVEIAVADDGRGIAAEDQPRIFGKFETARRGARGEGTGLGLWIVRKLLGVLGGSIALASAPEAGSTFTLTIPLSEPAGPMP